MRKATEKKDCSEAQWFGENISGLFGPCQWHLINSQGELQTELETNDVEFAQHLRQLLAEIDNTAQEQQVPLYRETFCFLPLAKVSNDYRWLVLENAVAHLDELSLRCYYYQLLYLLREAHYQDMQARLQSAEQWIQDELEEIARLQQLMLPDKDVKLPGIELAFTYRAMKSAGGDYLDIADLSRVTPNGEKDIGIIVADVSGHGPAAAVETAMIDAILRTFAPVDAYSGNSEVLSYLNKHFFTRKGRGRFLTAAVFRYSEREQCLHYANAGHPHAYLKKSDRLVPLDQGGIPIGVLREQHWQSYQVPVERGDTLFVYTDVVVETRSRQGEQLGFERLQQLLSTAPAEPEKLLAYLETEMNNFCGCTSYQDDLTMCAIQFS